MTKLIPLNEIPYRAREIEAGERAKWPTRAMALDAATYEIVDAEGTYSDPDPSSHGWVLTYQAAKAMSEIKAYPPGSWHYCYAYREWGSTSDALGIYLEDIARGVPHAEAVKTYEATRAGRTN